MVTVTWGPFALPSLAQSTYSSASTPYQAGSRAGTRTSEEGGAVSTEIFRRRARRPAPALPGGEIALLAPPELPKVKNNLAQMLMVLPMLGGAGAMMFMFAGAGGGRGRGPMMWVVGGLMGASMLGMTLMSVGRPQMGKKSELNDERRNYLRYLGVTRKQVRAAAEQQRTALFWRHPDPEALWSTAMSGRMWERRMTDDDFGVVRIGLGPQRLATRLIEPQSGPVDDIEPMAASALRRFLRTHSSVPDLPVAASLRGVARVQIAGDRVRTAALARAIAAQLVTLHSPEDLQIWVCAGPERRPDWDWVKWLPHVQHPAQSDAAGPRRLVDGRLAALEDLAGVDLTERPRFTPGAAAGADRAHLVVFIDGGSVGPDCQLGGEDGVAGVTVIDLVVPSAFERPEASRSTLRLAVDGERLLNLGPGGAELLGAADGLSVPQVEALARQIAPYRLGTTSDEEPLSANLGLTDLLGLGDPRDLDPAVTWRPRSTRERLRLPIGLGSGGEPVELDLKESAQEGMGPHGLVIGSTGSGKSELLRTLVLGLAMTHSSETLNFVLVDFKGGATFTGLAELPHTAAVITNLADDLTMVDRMRDALQGELLRRQELLKSAGNFASVRDYEKAREKGAELLPLPSLLVVCDEFSELLSAKPDFIDLFVAIGRLGRSLGIHLLLASQRLEEGRLRGLDSHLSYRVGLRTFSAAESRTVLGVPDAYELPSVPGSGYLKFDTTTLIRFKAAYVSGPYRRSVVRDRGGMQGSGGLPVPFSTSYVAPAAGPSVAIDTFEAETAEAAAPPVPETLLDVAVEQLTGRGPAAHQVWLPPLDAPPPLDALYPPISVTADRGLSPVDWPGLGALTVPVGLVDRPFEQRRDLLWADFSGAAGHAVVVGGPQSGKSTLLRTLIASLALAHTPAEVQFFCLDFGGGSLTSVTGLPHVGGVAGRLDPDMVRRMVAEVSGLLEERERRFYQLGIDGMPTYRARRAAGGMPEDPFGDVFLVIDGWTTFKTEFEMLEPTIIALATRGLSYGVHIVLGATRWAEIRAALRDLIGTRFELRLGDTGESEIDRRAAANVPEGSPGRGLTRDKLHLLTALPRTDGQWAAAGISDATAKMVASMAEAWHGLPSPRVRLLPAVFPATDLPAPDRVSSPAGIPIGIREADLGAVYLDFNADPHFLAFGDVESGKTGLMRLILTGITQRYTPEQARIIALDYRRGLLDAVDVPHMLGYATSSAAAMP
ncbi:MAG: type VII secretion protein EccC, partial [Pseudonocardiales bacterium]